MGGGLGLMPKEETFYEALNALPNTHVTILTGNNERLRAQLDGRYSHVDVVGFTDQVADYMASADLLLSKPGGITLFEAIFSELPILAWAPFLQQEINNAKFLVRAGIGSVAPKDPEACLSVVNALLNNEKILSIMRSRMRGMKGQLEHASLGTLLETLSEREARVS